MDYYFDMVPTSLQHGLHVLAARAGFRGGGQRAGEGLASSRGWRQFDENHRGLNGGTRIRMYSVCIYVYKYIHP